MTATKYELSEIPSNRPKVEKRQDIHTLSFLVANKPGVLVRVAQVFARRGFNIDSLVVSPTVNPDYSRMTITAQGDLGTLDQIIKQASKLIDVLHAGEHKQDESIEKELALFKIKYKAANKATVSRLLKKYNAHPIETTDSTMIVEQTGSTDMLDEFEHELKKYEILEMVRTGKILMAKGREAT